VPLDRNCLCVQRTAGNINLKKWEHFCLLPRC